ncbi:MAG: Re/Si-specific NAD(P)(+) transhydrogenase subunit alpha [Acidobacteria bacterium]|nr:Re/Si-specific NAD(P)(+) transhydrogenase subunit alpha [Acidobacteriota bacterium]
MIVGIPKETYPHERRVAIVPAHLKLLVKTGHQVVVQAGAGTAAGFPDDGYREKGARLLPGRDELFREAEIILQVRGFGANREAGKEDLARLRPDQVILAMFDPLSEPQAVQEVAGTGIAALALELMPRISRAQSMDVLSSMATISGYKAVLLAAGRLPRMFPMMMTAAGTLAPAKVFVIGAGVAGLQAIATARRLGAVVKAYDVRPAVKEQVESLGAKFVELPLESADAEDKGGYAKAQDEAFYKRQREMMAKVIAESDVVITTALIPGRQSPVLVTAEMVRGMEPGSVIVDLAAERGGNCELTRPDAEADEGGVIILGPTNLPASAPYHASQMYSKNMVTFLAHLTKEGRVSLDGDDPILSETLITRSGEVVHPRIREALGLVPAASAAGKE